MSEGLKFLKVEQKHRIDYFLHNDDFLFSDDLITPASQHVCFRVKMHEWSQLENHFHVFVEDNFDIKLKICSLQPNNIVRCYQEFIIALDSAKFFYNRGFGRLVDCSFAWVLYDIQHGCWVPPFDPKMCEIVGS